MATKGGTITRKDIIDDDALKYGDKLVEQTKLAINAIEDLKKSAKPLADILNSYRKVDSQSAFLDLKRQEVIANQQALNSINQLKEADLAMEKVRQAALITRKKELDLNSQLEKSTRLVTARTSEEIVNQKLLARNSDNLALANSKLASEYDKLGAKVKIAARSLQDILIKGKDVGESTSQYTLRLQKAQSEFDKLQSKVIAANRVIGRFNDNVGNYPKAALQNLKDLISAFGVVGGLQAFVSITKEAFNIVKNFEAEIVNLAAIAGKSREEIAPLEAEIRKVARASINGATDVAKLATELIKLGSTPEEAMKLLKPVNDLSVALKATAEDAASLVKGLLNAYQEGAEEATRYTDVLAESANRSALDFQGLRDAFSYLAPTAKTLNLSIEQTAAILGVLADNNIKAESAGRLTSTAFIKLATSGLTYQDALKQINKAQKENKSELEILALAGSLFGAESAKIGIILANNIDKIDASTKAYENSKGSLEELTNKQLKSVSAELQILDSEWEDYILRTNEASEGTQAITSTLRFLSGNLSEIINILIYSAGAWAGWKAAVLLANVQTKLMALNLTMTTTAQTANTIATEAGAVAQGESAVSTSLATTAWQRFNLALKANALLLIVTALIALIYYTEKYNRTLKEVTDEVQGSTDTFLKNRDVVSKNAVSLTTLANRYDELKAKTHLTIKEQEELNKIMQILTRTVPESTAKMGKYGETVEVNSSKVRDYIKLQNEVIKLKNAEKLRENIELLKKLSKEQDYNNVLTKEGKEAGIKGVEGKQKDFFIVKNINGVLKTRNNILEDWHTLTEKQLLTYKETLLAGEKELNKTNAQIAALKGLTDAQKLAAKAKGDAADKTSPVVKDIQYYRDLIKVQEDLIPKLSDVTGKQGAAIKAKIKGYEAEIEKIYSTQKADKDRTDNGIKNAKKLNEAIHQLNQAHYDNEISINQKIADDEERLIDDRIDALYTVEKAKQLKNEESLRYELEKNALEKVDLEKLSKAKFEIYERDSKKRIDLLLQGKIANEQMTNEEKLALKKYYDEKESLDAQSLIDKQKIIDSEVAIIKKGIDSEISENERRVNEALNAENIKFLETIEGKSLKEREDAIKEHERVVLEIRKKGAIDSAQLTVDRLRQTIETNDSETEDCKFSAKERKKLGQELANAEQQLSALKVQNVEDENGKKLLSDEEYIDKLKGMSEELADRLIGLANAIFDAKITKLDGEIQKNNEFYEQQIKLAEDDARKKDFLQKQQEKKNEELEKKKRKEQHKQAVFNKALGVLNASIKGAEAVVAALAIGPPQGIVFAAIAAATSAIEIATIVATPIPKYRGGRTGGPEELAIINDGDVTEVVSDPDGSNPRTAKSRNALVQLLEGDIVHKSKDDYKKFMRASMMASINIENNRLNSYQAGLEYDRSLNQELLQEMKKNTEAVKNQKQNVTVNAPKIDFGHELWKFRNTNWNA